MHIFGMNNLLTDQPTCDGAFFLLEIQSITQITGPMQCASGGTIEPALHRVSFECMNGLK